MNQVDIHAAIDHLEAEGYEEYEVYDFRTHQNLEIRRKKTPRRQGRCNGYMRLITLWENMVYPCCAMFCVEGWDNHTRATDAIRETGWHIDNPNLVATMKDHKNTIPQVFFDACAGCWSKKDKRHSEGKSIAKYYDEMGWDYPKIQ